MANQKKFKSHIRVLNFIADHQKLNLRLSSLVELLEIIF
jgi:hypothetical protein